MVDHLHVKNTAAIMDSQNPLSGSYTWKIDGFSGLPLRKYTSEVFTVGSCEWEIVIYPQGRMDRRHFAIYLDIPDCGSFLKGWSIEAEFTLWVINQNDEWLSFGMGEIHEFKSSQPARGFPQFMTLSDLRNLRKGFLVKDTLILKAEVDVRSISPLPLFPEAAPPAPTVEEEMDVPPNTAPSVTGTSRFDSFFTKLEEFMVSAHTTEGPGPSNVRDNQMDDPISGYPSSEEVEAAKRSLKECLSDLFQFNMKDRVTAALSTLIRAEVGLSPDQQRSIMSFWDNYDGFISDVLAFEQDNFDCELQKHRRDQIFSALGKHRSTHVSNKQLLEALAEEENELKKRMEEVNMRKEKLISDWEGLVAKSEEMKCKYKAQEKTVAKAERKKRIAEERMSRSTAAWSSLKAQFLKAPAASEEGTKSRNVPPSEYVLKKPKLA